MLTCIVFKLFDTATHTRCARHPFDVNIWVSDGRINAHSAILVAASPLFERVLLAPPERVTPDALPAPFVGAERIVHNCDDRAVTVLRIGGVSGAALTARGVRNVIEWLYTGDCVGLPGRVSATDLAHRGALAGQAPGKSTCMDS